MTATFYATVYQTVRTEASDPQQTLLLLVEGALRLLHQARAAMARGDYQGQCEPIVRAQRILSTLMTSLDHTVAPDLAQSLMTTYAWMHHHLTEASIRDDPERLGQVVDCLTQLYGAWTQARQQLLDEGARPAPRRVA